jgi:DNA (cytosine-5)-methyltransferase 1
MTHQAGHAWHSHTQRMQRQFILSLFPGIDTLGRAFTSAGHTVVRGPDLVTGDRIEDFHGLAGHIDGIIAGPPCQDFSSLRRTKPSGHGIKMLRELLRVLNECDPTWAIVENVPRVPNLSHHGRLFQRLDLTDKECGGEQIRRRHWQWWHRKNIPLAPVRSRCDRPGPVTPAVTATPRKTQPTNYPELCKRMGLPTPIYPAGWSHRALCHAIGNAVTWPMATTIATAVSQAIAGGVTTRLCICGCGRAAPYFGEHATAACRKRMERQRRSTRHTIGL